MIRHDTALTLGASALDFELPAHERSELDGHLAVCETCRRRVHDVRVDAGSLADLPVRPVNARRADAILARALAEPRHGAEPLRLVIVAALLALLSLGSLAIGAELVRRVQNEHLGVVLPVPTQSLAPAPSDMAPAPSGAPEPSGGPEPSGAPAWGDSGVGTAWTQVEVPETAQVIPGGGAMSGVIAGGPGAISWGQVYGAGPRIWTSIDGTSWKPATIKALADWDPEAMTPGIVSSVSAGGPGYVAVGFYDRLGTGRRAVVWTSTDGLTWSLVPHDPLFEHALMYRVLSWQGRLWVFGNAGMGAGGAATEPLAWSSADGVTWQSETLSLPNGKGLSVIDAAADRLWGTLYALGDDLGMEPLVLATSTDGHAWAPSGLPVQRTSSMHVVDGALVTLAVPVSGSTSPLAPGAYRSTDGTTWEPLVTAADTVGNDIIDAGGTLVMVGDDAKGDGACGAGCHAAGWRSVDGGQTWTLVTTDTAGGLMDAVTALPDRTLVAVGRVIDGNGNAGLGAWVSPPADLPAATPAPSPIPAATPAATPPMSLPSSAPPSAPTAGASGELVAVLDVRCGPGAPTLGSDRVRASRDGVGIRVTGEPGWLLGIEDESRRESVPLEATVQDLVLGIAPGNVTIDCGDPTLPGLPPASALRIEDPDNWYRPMSIGNGAGSCVSGSASYGNEARGKTTDPVRQAQGLLRGLQAGDQVERGGYATDKGWVRVVRADEVIGVLEFNADGHGGWLLMGSSLCGNLSTG